MKFRILIAAFVVACLFGSATAQTQFNQQGPKLVGTGVVGNADQGFSVSISGDGNTAIVGGPYDNNFAGAAWVYTRLGGVWTQQGLKLVGADAVGNADQGSSVSISGDGNTAIIGGPTNVGAAWVFTRSGNVWSQQGPKLVGTGGEGTTQQGVAVSISGDGNTAIVSGPGDITCLGNECITGSLWVFTRSGGVWTQQGPKLVVKGAISSGPCCPVIVGSSVGLSASLSSDGNTAIVGGPTDNDSIGAAWVFTRSAGLWSQQAKLVGTGGIGQPRQGEAVSLSADGNTAVVGGDEDNTTQGAMWVFTRSGRAWSQQGPKLVGSGVEPASGVARQGFSVSISSDGNTAIEGGLFDGNVDNFGNHSGAVWAFTRSGGVWSQLGPKLVGTGAISNAQQGTSASISGDGNTVIEGGPQDNGNPAEVGIGATWVFVRPVFAGTPGKSNCFGQSVTALQGQYGGLSGAAAALGFSSVGALQNAILAFCGA